tara:strand:- start:8236 stop:8907 length:672 start_codon:yes stop_codon:yes gene_type:complete
MDMGIRNFAFWVDTYDRRELPNIAGTGLHYQPNGEPTDATREIIERVAMIGKTVFFSNEDVATGDDTRTEVSSDTLCTISELLDSHVDIFSKCDYIVVERQMQFGKVRNPKAIRVAHHVQSYFLMMFGRLANIVDFPAYHKTQVLGAPKIKTTTKKGTVRYKAVDKPARKKWAVKIAEDVLLARCDSVAIEKIEDMKKKDDVSDCLIQGIAFVLLHLIGRASP